MDSWGGRVRESSFSDRFICQSGGSRREMCICVHTRTRVHVCTCMCLGVQVAECCRREKALSGGGSEVLQRRSTSPGPAKAAMGAVLPPGGLGQRLDIFGHHSWGRSATGIRWVAARDATKHLVMPRTVLHNKELSGSK